MSLRGERGFTLVEVLIAAVIMFTVLATATVSLRGALHASERASRTTELLAPLPWITPTIRENLRANPAPERSGEGIMFGVEYRFRALLVRSGAPPPRFDPDVIDFIEYAPRFGLYDIELELEREGETSSFVYQELAWSPLAQ
jgi:prepilin-type N-terminal cleavage/methylation domain-containing protein